MTWPVRTKTLNKDSDEVLGKQWTFDYIFEQTWQGMSKNKRAKPGRSMSPDLSAELQAAANKATKQINRIMEIEFPKAALLTYNELAAAATSAAELHALLLGSGNDPHPPEKDSHSMQDSPHHLHQPERNALGPHPQIADRIARRYYHIHPGRWATRAANRHGAW
ncbi:hypothetical protein C6P46_002220 [Rhodotorula mucilaginosa]|uniref:Uncharacterized protein n=1 Tax=Rhodotorula mucilaginosa TaxID=5537 RepID=A0A9P6VTZ0_RHOMI|nr:hypothetical protein C6P46_002220 [Rhodotorula mucilaginosa]TKA50656.1 hypothetical protein B0A53_06173 [Rhodotorula sp. CCFEE 5036]